MVRDLSVVVAMECEQQETTSTTTSPLFQDVYDTVADAYRTHNQTFLTSLADCVESLFQQITCEDDALRARLYRWAETASSSSNDPTTMTIWNTRLDAIEWQGFRFKLRVLLKGPDKGGVFGYPWLARKGVEPLLVRLKRHYAPFDVHFVSYTQGGGVRVNLSWP